MKVISHYKKSGDDARLILTGMIVSGQVVAAVSQKWTRLGLFGVPFADRIGGWCVQHYKDYHKPPGNTIQHYFRKWVAEHDRPKEEVSRLEEFLSGLSEQYLKREAKTVQVDYILKIAEAHFTKVRIDEVTTKAKELADAGQLDKANELIRKHDKVEMTEEEMVDFFANDSVIDMAWEQKAEAVITYPGAAGVFFGNRMKRKELLSFEGMEKSGKSFFLLDAVCRAVQQGRKVAWFEAGDLNREDIVMRMAARALGRAVDTDPYQYPISMEARKEGDVSVVHDDRKHDVSVTKDEAKVAFHKMRDRYGKNSIRLSCHPARTLSVPGIVSRLERIRDSEGVTFDLVVVDYSDILAPVNGTAETRDQINLNWIMLRALAMSQSCLVLTATQTNRASYDAKVIGMEHASEDKRKRGHVAASIGINQDDTEKESGIYRLNWITARHGKFDRNKCLVTASCLATSNPIVLSTWGLE